MNALNIIGWTSFRSIWNKFPAIQKPPQILPPQVGYGMDTQTHIENDSIWNYVQWIKWIDGWCKYNLEWLLPAWYAFLDWKLDAPSLFGFNWCVGFYSVTFAATFLNQMLNWQWLFIFPLFGYVMPNNVMLKYMCKEEIFVPRWEKYLHIKYKFTNLMFKVWLLNLQFPIKIELMSMWNSRFQGNSL